MTRDEAVQRALALDPLGGDALTVLAVEAGEVADLLLDVAAKARREALEEAATSVNDLLFAEDEEAELWTAREAIRESGRAIRRLAEEG